MPALSKAEQVAEQIAEQKTLDTQAGREHNATLAPETTRAEDAPTEQAAPVRDVEAPAVPAHMRRPDPRDEIVKRFRTEVRPHTEAEEDAADIRAFANQGLPPEMAQQDEPAEDARAEGAQNAAEAPVVEVVVPQRTVKVRGADIDLTTLSQEQLLSALQKGLAGDSYLDEARQILDDSKARMARVDDLLKQTDQRVRGPAPERPGNETTETPAADPSEHPETDPFVKVVQDIAFETPENAAKTLRTVIADAIATGSKQSTTEALKADRRNEELSRNRKVLGELQQKHPDIASDSLAIAAIKQNMAEMQRKDLLDLGLNEAVIPPITDQKTLGEWHLHYRTEEGVKVRRVDDMMNEAIDNFRKWKGGTAEPAAETATKGAPRVVVKVDRTERRTVIPQQPTRTVVPRANESQQAQPRDRSAVVQQMARNRMQVRGRVTG